MQTTELTAPASTIVPRTVQRVRHALKLRRVEVLRTQQLSLHIVSVTFGGEALHDFVSASFDDHVKLMLPSGPGQALVLPDAGPDGPVWPDGAMRPVMRDYTPRRFDPSACELDIEFALHGDGPAAAWAAQAAPGQPAGVGGPRGSFIVPMDFDWHLLIGDDTALPAIARRLEELPAGSKVIALIDVGDAADRRELPTRADLQLTWVTGGPGNAADVAASDSAPGSAPVNALVNATRALQLPPGEGYAWAAGEARTIAAVRAVLVDELGLDKGSIRAAAYWKHGRAAHHENL